MYEPAAIVDMLRHRTGGVTDAGWREVRDRSTHRIGNTNGQKLAIPAVAVGSVHANHGRSAVGVCCGDEHVCRGETDRIEDQLFALVDDLTADHAQVTDNDGNPRSAVVQGEAADV